MGRSTTPTFIIQWTTQRGVNSSIWNSAHYGRPIDANLEKWRRSMNESFKSTGCNFHISRSAGFILHVSEATIIDQKNGDAKVAHTKMPMFEEV